jgi:hypothetical protein
MKIETKKDLISYLEAQEKIQKFKTDKLFKFAVNQLAGEIANTAYNSGLRYGDDWKEVLKQYA